MNSKQMAIPATMIITACLFAGSICASESNLSLFQDLNWLQTDTIMLAQAIRTDPLDIELLPPSSGINFYRDGVLVLALPENSREKRPWNSHFKSADTFYGELSGSGILDQVPFLYDEVFNYPTDGITFTGDYSTIYYTGINNKNGISNIYGAKLQYEGNRMTKSLVDLYPMNLYNDYNNSHPTISADGEIMIFSSDREGTIGGTDLFITRYIDGKWSEPERMPGEINTPENELFSFLDSKNNLFFSSNGRSGSGGYDVYVCRYNGIKWNSPVNLASPVNSQKDDIAFRIDPVNEEFGFVTRRDRDRKGGTQLYRITIEDSLAAKTGLTLSEILINKAINGYVLLKPPVPESIETDIVGIETDTVDKSRAGINIIKEPPLPDNVVFKVQILSVNPTDMKPEVVIGGKPYNASYYLFEDAWRMTIGEFTDLEEAVELKNICRLSGYDEAFVAAFVNGERSLDMSLFRR